MRKLFAQFIFYIIGWKVVGEFPEHSKKIILLGAPHYKGAQDFVLGIFTRDHFKRKLGFLGKAELVDGPFGFVFKALGGIPVYRDTSNNLVENQVKAIDKIDNIILAIAPEGSRKNVSKLKSGFYHIAVGAKMDIMCLGFDYENKEIVLGGLFTPSNNFKEDMVNHVLPFYEKIGGPKKDWFQNYKNGIFDADKLA